MKKQVFVISSFLVMLCFVFVFLKIQTGLPGYGFILEKQQGLPVDFQKWCGCISPFNTTAVNAFDWKPVFKCSPIS